MAVSVTWPTIRKGAWPAGVTPNVVDYESARAGFSWDAARRALDGLPGGRGLNIAHEAVDRHAAGASRDRVAVRWLRRDGRRRRGDLRAAGRGRPTSSPTCWRPLASVRVTASSRCWGGSRSSTWRCWAR